MAVKANVAYRDGSANLMVWYQDMDCNNAIMTIGITESKAIESIELQVIGEDEARELCEEIFKMFGDADEA